MAGTGFRPTMTPNFLPDALAYGDAGWPIFPLIPRSKRPATANGLHDATTDPATIRAWWTARPAANIGLRLVPGVIVLDVDPRNGGNLDALGSLPATWTARTGGGGWHLLYRYRGDTVGRVRDADGIDVKTSNGYIVAAPSIHPDGGRYEWINEHPVVALPTHLHARVRREPARRMKGTGRTSAPGGLVSVVSAATEGNRNNALYWAACRAAESHAPDEVWHDLRASAVLVGLEDQEIERTIQSALARQVAGR